MGLTTTMPVDTSETAAHIPRMTSDEKEASARAAYAAVKGIDPATIRRVVVAGKMGRKPRISDEQIRAQCEISATWGAVARALGCVESTVRERGKVLGCAPKSAQNKDLATIDK